MNLLSSFKKHVARLMSLSMMAWSLCGLVTLTGALLTYALWQQAKHEDTRKLRSTLEYSADVTVKNILNRLNAYQVMMRGVKGHIDGSDYVTADEFRDYIASLRLDTQAGLKGVALVTLVKHQDKERHIAEKRKQGYPGYTIFPEGIRDFYTPITAIEPLDEENLKALGFDTWTGTSSREAMERSRDDNDIRITSHFTLIQDQERSNSHAFVMYLPIFKKRCAIKHSCREARGNYRMGGCTFSDQ